MSKPNLPDIPHELLETLSAGEVPLVRAYAEEAVRQALAAQVPVAWVIDARRGLSDPQFCWGNPDGVYKSLYVPLALIPENSDG